MSTPGNTSNKNTGDMSFQEKDREMDVRVSNIVAANAVAGAVRTSLGPRGADKMIENGTGGVIISNDGATILKSMALVHPVAKMLVGLSAAQDTEAGDGTTSVVVLAGSMLQESLDLLQMGIHPTVIAESYQVALDLSLEHLRSMAIAVDLADRDALIRAAKTSLSSKVVSNYASTLAPIAVDAVMGVMGATIADTVDLNDIRVTKQLGGTVEDAEIVNGLVFPKLKARGKAGGPQRIKNASIALIQYQLSPPKTDMENHIIVASHTQLDRVIAQEKKYTVGLIKKLKKAGVNVLLIQKSILRDAVSDLALHYLAKAGILVVTDVERADIEFICRTIGCLPIAHPDHLAADKLGTAELVECVGVGANRLLKVTGVANPGKTQTVLVRGSNHLVLEEAERSLHDALCVVRSIVKERSLISGGGAPEIELSIALANHAKTLTGAASYCVKRYGSALEVIPYTLAENAGLNALAMVTQLRNDHVNGSTHHGINVRRGCISDMHDEEVIQPLLVNTSALKLATELSRAVLKIDEIVQSY